MTGWVIVCGLCDREWVGLRTGERPGPCGREGCPAGPREGGMVDKVEAPMDCLHRQRVDAKASGKPAQLSGSCLRCGPGPCRYGVVNPFADGGATHEAGAGPLPEGLKELTGEAAKAIRALSISHGTTVEQLRAESSYLDHCRGFMGAGDRPDSFEVWQRRQQERLDAARFSQGNVARFERYRDGGDYAAYCADVPLLQRPVSRDVWSNSGGNPPPFPLEEYAAYCMGLPRSQQPNCRDTWERNRDNPSVLLVDDPHANCGRVCGDSVVEAVRADLLERSNLGVAKYGTTLEREDLTLTDWMQHAYEETLDQANYLKRCILEMRGSVGVVRESADDLTAAVDEVRATYPDRPFSVEWLSVSRKWGCEIRPEKGSPGPGLRGVGDTAVEAVRSALAATKP